MNRNCRSLIYTFMFSFCLFTSYHAQANLQVSSDKAPRIINIVNFIRQTDYRLENADSLLFDATEKQVALLKKYNFPGTFLLQYDALINPKYQQLLLEQLDKASEIGAWWEITQPHVEAAGITWRGKHSWVSTANIAFTTGYTPQEREKLVDVYMKNFKAIFGRYPKSVGSWYIDSHTLMYMYEKYHIVASSNCKDQVGTDGYTLWGGYWNQAYYPSKKNAYMPAQTAAGQIPVPIFRMLGSDPIYQYDTGVGTNGQSVITLEPVYKHAGMDKKWTAYFLESLVDQPCLAFGYAQAGQENSFTWDEMKDGLEMQFSLFDSLRKAGKIRIETLQTSGEWFKKEFPLTPATAVTALKDVQEAGNKSIWYNSRYYRTNLYWEENGFRIRDIHLFDEQMESPYLKTPGVGGQFLYFTLPLIDGFFWSTKRDRAGMCLMKIDEKGKREKIILKEPVVTAPKKGILRVNCLDQQGNEFTLIFNPDKIEVQCQPKIERFNWVMELQVPQERLDQLPFQSYSASKIGSEFRGFNYDILVVKGNVNKGDGSDFVFQLAPSANKVTINTNLRMR